MNFYHPIYFETEDSITLKYDTIAHNDVETVLQSILAYKKLLLKTSSLLTGDYTENFEENFPEISIIIDKYYKGSDVFDFILKLTPKKHQQRVLIASTVLLGIGSLFFTANQILDFYIKINKINEKITIEKEFEEFKKEVNEKINKGNHLSNDSCLNVNYKIPTSFYKVIDSTFDDYQTFIKPIKQGQAKSISIIKSGTTLKELNKNNSLDFNAELVNQRFITNTHEIKFTRIDATNKKAWKISLPDNYEVKAEIKDELFFSNIKELSENPLNKEKTYSANILEYWQREKGQEIFQLKKVDILTVINP